MGAVNAYIQDQPSILAIFTISPRIAITICAITTLHLTLLIWHSEPAFRVIFTVLTVAFIAKMH